MKSILTRSVLIPAASLVLLACSGDVDTTSQTTDQVSAEESVRIGATFETRRLVVGPELVDCVGEAPQQCMQVRWLDSEDWELFYDDIVGFTPSPGVTATLLVEVMRVLDPPADASSLSYELIEVVETSTDD